MREFTLIALQVLFLPVAFASGQDWVVRDAHHPLWSALDVPVAKIEHRYLNIEEKTAGHISCRKTSVKSFDSEPTQGSETTCAFPSGLTTRDVSEFFDALKTKALRTSGAYTEIKVVDRLIVVKSEQQSRFYLEHPCRQVSSRQDSEHCMQFWATEVLPSFKAANNVAVVEASAQNRDLVKASLRWVGYRGKSLGRAQKLVDAAAFIGMMEERQDELRFYHFALKSGANVVPRVLWRLNEADVEYTPLGAQASQVASTGLAVFVREVFQTLFLGQDPDLFGDFAESLRERLTDLNHLHQAHARSSRHCANLLEC